jgi:C4-dicarboxylate-specific signal transduction histidine kinase
MAKMVERLAKKKFTNDEYLSSLERPLGHIIRAAEAIQTFANMTTTLLQKEKRRGGRTAVHPVIEGIAQLFAPFLDESRVTLVQELSADGPTVFGSISSVESILANLITNSLNAFMYEHANPVNRQIVIRTERNGDELILKVRDNGPGIDGLPIEDIWLPGQSTTPGGTGLGLTIVKDAVTELGGTVEAQARGALGGAEFTVTLPLLEEK